MDLEEYSRELGSILANTSDEELAQWFVLTHDDQIRELGRLSGHKYLSPSMMEERQEIIGALIEEGVMVARFDNTLMNSICTFFDFIEPNKAHNERIYQEAFGKQLLKSPESEN